MKVLLTHPGTQHSFQLAKQLYKRGILYEFHTGFAFGKDSFFYRIFSRLPAKIYRKISNRFIDEVPDQYIKRKAYIEIAALIKLKLGRDEEDVLYHRNKQFQESISSNAITNADAVIGFDTSSWILAERCKALSTAFILDVSIAHPVAKEMVYRRIIKIYPKWKFFVKTKDYKHIAVEEAEMELATHIVVASSFTDKTYEEQGVSASKISINPYGVDANLFRPLKKERKADDPIRFVFVGTVDARKGIPFLLQTWSKLTSKNIELTLIGSLSTVIEHFIIKNYPFVQIKGRLPFSEVKRILPYYDVLIFPSFFEGFGLVIPEAMSSGLPVITTTATCGPDIIDNGIDGFVIDPGDEVKLKTAIEYFIQQPDKIATLGSSARLKAEQISWDAYGARWKTVLEQTCQIKNRL